MLLCSNAFLVAAAFSADGDGGRKSPKRSAGVAQRFKATRAYRTIATYEYTP